MKRPAFCAALMMFAAVSICAFAADTPKRSSAQRAAAERALADREAAAARAEAERARAESAEVSELEARHVPRSAVQERKLRSAPGDMAERLKAAEAYVLEAQDSPSKLDAAAAHVDKILESNPNNVPALMLAGHIDILRGQPALAQLQYQAATAADPGSAAAFLGLGDSWSRHGNDERASLAYNEYRRLNGLAAVAAPGSAPPSVTPPGQAAPRIIGPGREVKSAPRRSRS